MDTQRVKWIVMITVVLLLLASIGCKRETEPSAGGGGPGETGEKAETEAVDAGVSPGEESPAEESPGETSPTEPASAEESRTEEMANLPSVTDEGIVTYLSGDVSIHRGENWSALDVDDPVNRADTVRTSGESYCEVQFTDFGIIRIKENTELVVSSLFLEEKESRVNLKLKKGSVLCKVKKLGKDEEFEVSTSSSLAGVRGTEFAVTEEKGKTTVISVKEGKVSVVPVEIAARVEEIKENAQTETAKNLVDELEVPEVIVTEDKEISIEQAQADQAVQDFEDVSREIEEKVKVIDEKAAAIEEKQQGLSEKPRRERKKNIQEVEILQEEIQKLQDTVKSESADNSEQIKKHFDNTESLSDESQKELEEIDRMKQVEVIASGKKDRRERREAAEPVLTKLIVEVEPDDAEIYIDGEPVGTGEYRGLFEPEREIHLRVQKRGYKTEERSLTIPSSREMRLSIELKNPVTWRIRGGAVPFVRKPLVVGNRIVLADGRGTLSCFDSRGRRVWRVRTENNPNENSIPVLAGDRVVFSGVSELISADLARGSIFERVNLSSAHLSNHLFGRTVVPFGDYLLYPSDDAIDLLDAKTLEKTKSIAVPDSTAGTPAIQNGSILIVNRRGELLIIDPETGRVKKRIPTDAFQSVAARPTLIGSRAVFADNRGRIVCVDTETGDVLWQHDLPGGEHRGVYREIAAEGDRVYPYDGAAFYAVSLDRGSVELGPVDSTCQPLVAKGRIYYGDAESQFLIMSGRNGRVVKSWPLDSPITTQPQLWRGGVLVSTRSGAIYLLDEDKM